MVLSFDKYDIRIFDRDSSKCSDNISWPLFCIIGQLLFVPVGNYCYSAIDYTLCKEQSGHCNGKLWEDLQMVKDNVK